MENLLVYVLRLILCVVLLSYASIQDVLKREVSNKVWLVGIPSCLVLDYIDFYFGNIWAVYFFASLAVGLIIGFALFYLGFYGGADSKALMLISVAAPSYLLGTASLVTMVFPLPTLLIFFCSTLFTALYPLTVLALNLIDLCKGKHLLRGIEEKNVFKRLFLYIVVRRIKFEDFEKSLKLFPAEKIAVEDGKVVRKPIYHLNAEANIDDLVKELEEHREFLKDGILVSPTIPMIVFLTIGFIFSNIVSTLI